MNSTQHPLLDYLARSCAYAQEHIDDLDAWPASASRRLELLQCTSFQVACFLAQTTQQGEDGVFWDVVIDQLVEHPAKSEAEWTAIIDGIANSYGGWTTDQEAKYQSRWAPIPTAQWAATSRPSDLDKEGRSWRFLPPDDTAGNPMLWEPRWVLSSRIKCGTHRLPHFALPVPEAAND
jgi:hypothetical protein